MTNTMWNVPVPFQGTMEQRRTNFASHRFTTDDGDYVCLDCECKPAHEGASYPCGADVPRQNVSPEVGAAGFARFIARMHNLDV